MVTKKRLQAICEEIRSFCVDHADEAIVAKYSRFFTEGYDAYGLSTEIYNQQKEIFFNAHKQELDLVGFLQLGDFLLVSGKYEEASFAINFVEKWKTDYTKETFPRLTNWLRDGIRNWGHTDVLCSTVLSHFLESKIVELEDFTPWRESESKWQRRAVPVTMLCLLKENNKVQPLLDFLEPLMLDTDRFVQQGVGWFLREAWKKQPQAVEKFLLKWKDQSSRKIYQYATEKMSKQEKERFRKEKKKTIGK